MILSIVWGYIRPSLYNTDNASGNDLPLEFPLGSSAWAGEKVSLGSSVV